jgi:hypothetical protein
VRPWFAGGRLWPQRCTARAARRRRGWCVIPMRVVHHTSPPPSGARRRLLPRQIDAAGRRTHRPDPVHPRCQGKNLFRSAADAGRTWSIELPDAPSGALSGVHLRPRQEGGDFLPAPQTCAVGRRAAPSRARERPPLAFDRPPRPGYTARALARPGNEPNPPCTPGPDSGPDDGDGRSRAGGR